MKLTVLTENTACREDLTAEHGLSLYIEACGKKILFDSGASAAFAQNAETLGVDLSGVDLMILSHGHYDHGGGIRKFLELNETAPVYLHKNAFAPCVSAAGAYIGIDKTLRNCDRLHFVSGKLQLAPGLWLYDCNRRKRYVPVTPYGLGLRRKNTMQPENFLHEQYLLIEEAGKKICISGCSHKGIENIVKWFSPDILVGGFHFMRLEDTAVLQEKADTLLKSNAVFYTGHCTGQMQFSVLKERMGDRLFAIPTGTVLEV